MRLHEIDVVGSHQAWHDLGFTFRSVDGDVPAAEHSSSDAWIVVPDLSLRLRDGQGSQSDSPASWTFVDDSTVTRPVITMSIDGITTIVTTEPARHEPDHHRLGILGVDHVVVMTGSLDRTCGAIAEVLGLPLKRIRDAGRGVRQGFHRAGAVILEIVERPDVDPETPASLWGLVFTVSDLDDAVAWLGPDVIGSPRDAVQQGRRIATIRSQVGLGLAVALMTPESGLEAGG